MEIQRTFDLLDRYKANFQKVDAFAVKENKNWKIYSTEDYINYAHHFAYGLLELGFLKGDKIATISHNCPEWNFIDMGMSMIGIIHVPLYTSLNMVEYTDVINHCDAKMMIISDRQLYKKIETILPDLPKIEKVFTFNVLEGIPNWNDIVTLGEQNKAKWEQTLQYLKKSITPKDCVSLIYTSGTTGTPKGVMLSHENLAQNFLAAAKIFQLKPEQRYLSILPLCHVGGRLGNYQTQYSGTSIYYAENMGTIAGDMKEIKPHGFDAVPRILEKIYDTIISNGKKLTGIKKKLFFWAVDLGLNYKIEEESSWIYKQKLKLADKLIFSKWRAAIGGLVESVGCGGASLPTHIEKIFWAAGIKILNMYGLTETSPIITINRSNSPFLKLGSVGCVIDGVELKIAEDGEILCKGHDVMLGYYKNEDLTKQVFTEDGWFKTGDIGHLVDGKYLMVTDRKKEIFKLSNGKYVAPQAVEIKYKNSIFIENLMVVGEHKKYAGAVISPNLTNLIDWMKSKNIPYENQDTLLNIKEVTDLYRTEIQRLNKTVSEFEKIIKFRLVADQWSPNTGELSATLKLKRNYISKKYQEEIEEIFR
jgi:long-chain acyl-CoA synthetase